MNKDSKIFIAGHRGMVGSAILRRLREEGFSNFVLRTSAELDLRDQKAVADFFAAEKPEYVFLAAAKVGGIVANNTYRADFICFETVIVETKAISKLTTADYAQLINELKATGMRRGLILNFGTSSLEHKRVVFGYSENLRRSAESVDEIYL